MTEFLELVPPFQALKVLIEHLPEREIPSEVVSLQDGSGRVLVNRIFAPEPLPAFSRSTVDGFAVIAADTHGASDSLPMYLKVVGEVPMGDEARFKLNKGETAVIHTGGMLPEAADAVVMIENTQISRPGEIEIYKSVGKFENILRQGEDVQVGDLILEQGIVLRAPEIGGLAALGITRIQVAKKPMIGILSSGDEVISPDQNPKPGQVRDINSYSLSTLVQQAGGLPKRYGIVPDQASILESALRKALQENDMVIITAGSSASVRDLTAQTIQKMGEPGVLVHGVNIKPGKPTILAVCDGKPVIGLPGNPVSALVIASVFVIPTIEKIGGKKDKRPAQFIPAKLTVNLSSQTGREDWIPVNLIPDKDGYLAEPIFYKSNLIFSLAKADGLIHIPADANGLPIGEIVKVYSL